MLNKRSWVRVDVGEELSYASEDCKLWVPNLNGSWDGVAGASRCIGATLEFLSSSLSANCRPHGEVNSIRLVQSICRGGVGPWPIGD